MSAELSPAGGMKCHYEVLEIERQATSEDIRSAYKRLALRWHPDRNREQQEEAHLRFQEIQQAYATLSDSNSRAWYDAHREQILRTGGDGTRSSSGGDREEDIAYDSSVNIFECFTPGFYKGYGTDSRSFYAKYGAVFHKLDDEEVRARASPSNAKHSDSPEFGNANSSAEDIRKFYGHWENFVTCKTFTWHDIYNPSEAPNRDARREIDRVNQKARAAARKDYMDRVRNFVAHVKRRDRRIAELAVLELRRKEEEARQAESARKKSEKERLEMKKISDAEAARYLEETLTDEVLESFSHGESEEGNRRRKASARAEVEEETLYYCDYCRKKFKSDQQLGSHERSKKHIQRVKEAGDMAMLAESLEDVDAGLSPQCDDEGSDEDSDAFSQKSSRSQSAAGSRRGSIPNVLRRVTLSGTMIDDVMEEILGVSAAEMDRNADVCDAQEEILNTSGRSAVEEALASLQEPEQTPSTPEPKLEEVEAEEPELTPPTGSVRVTKSGKVVKKRRAKGEKGAGKVQIVQSSAAEEEISESSGIRCGKCNAEFSSKTKLHKHLDKTGHALPK